MFYIELLHEFKKGGEYIDKKMLRKGDSQDFRPKSH
jgi:hypothetical protein